MLGTAVLVTVLALLFLVPGVGDSFRVNGRATLTTDPLLLAPCAVGGLSTGTERDDAQRRRVIVRG